MYFMTKNQHQQINIILNIFEVFFGLKNENDESISINYASVIISFSLFVLYQNTLLDSVPSDNE